MDKVINSNTSIFIKGPARSGTSQFIRDYKSELDSTNNFFLRLAPTNLAALNIDGTTIY